METDEITTSLQNNGRRFGQEAKKQIEASHADAAPSSQWMPKVGIQR